MSPVLHLLCLQSEDRNRLLLLAALKHPHGLIKAFCTKTHTNSHHATWEQFINRIPAILNPCHLPDYFHIKHWGLRPEWSPGLCFLFELPDNASPLAAHQSARGRIGAFHSFFQIGWPRLQPFTGCGKLEIKRLPFTPLSSSTSSSPSSLCSSSLRPPFPAHAIVWIACSLTPSSPRQVLFSFEISC